VKEGTKEDLARHRIQKAKERLKISKELLDLGHSADSLSKSYYAMFSAAKALLALKELIVVNIQGLFLFLIDILLRRDFFQRNPADCFLKLSSKGKKQTMKISLLLLKRMPSFNLEMRKSLSKKPRKY